MTALYERYGAQLLGYATRQVGAADAEELVLDAFMRLVQYDGPIDCARGFLYMVLRGRIIDTQRKRLPPVTDLVSEPAVEPTVLHDLIRQQEREALEDAMTRLKAIQQEAITLYLQGRTGKEIAARLEVSEVMGRKILSQARKALCQLLREEVA